MPGCHRSLSARAFALAGMLSCAASLGRAAENPIYPSPTIVPVAASVAGVAQPVIALSDGWRMQRNPSGEYWSNAIDPTSWTQVQGGRGGRGGRGGGGGNLTAYKRQIMIPADWAGKRAILRFDGTAHAATLWVNGVKQREHWGSFMPWTQDITDQIKPGESVWITLGVDESPTGLAAFIRGGGMQRGAELMAVPKNYLTRLHAETDFDADYKNAVLKIHLTMALHGGDRAEVKLSLKDPKGAPVAISPERVEMTSASADQIVEIPVRTPLHWDAEHPNLYTLEASVIEGDQVLETLSRAIGFRKIEQRGNQLFVNGKEVKLRGIWGGNSVAGLKALNANHTRQLWVTESFLDDADRLGLYVLDENPIDFAKYGAESDSRYASQWLELTSGLIERDRTHPSVIIWGLDNESFNGANVLKAFKYARAEDPQRPVFASWANRVPVDQELPYTIYSSHYPDLNDPNLNLGDYMVAKWHSNSLILDRKPKPVLPVLHDEYSHTILNAELRDRDPEVRNFWGESIFRYWEKMFVTQGALGGDIFGLPGFNSGSAEPYLVYKAYSPIRIADQQPLENPGAGKALSIPIKNWYDHTNLSEITCVWSVDGKTSGTLTGPDIAPHGDGSLILPARDWKDGELVDLQFFDATRFKVDEYKLTVGKPAPIAVPAPQGPAPKLEQTESEIIVTGERFRIVFSRFKGLISDGAYDGKTVIIDGPFIDLLGSGLAYAEWWCDNISARIEGNEAVVEIAGNYAIFKAHFEVRIDGTGLIATHYTIDFIPGDPPPPTFSPWDATSVGGYSEVGVSYVLPSAVEQLSWSRKGLWSVYPEGHLGRNLGWAENGTDDFRATKENIYSAVARVAGGSAMLTAISDGTGSVRMSETGSLRSQAVGTRMGIHNLWNYPDFGLGNYAKPPVNIRSGYSNTVYLRLSGESGAGEKNP